jgi:hypothetical protein
MSTVFDDDVSDENEAPIIAPQMWQAIADYRRLGWRIMPMHGIKADGSCTCDDPTHVPGGAGEKTIGKHPIFKGGADFIEENHAHDAFYRRAARTVGGLNIAVCLGSKSRIVALDIDERNGGLASLELIKKNYGMPKTVEAESGGGGRHFYFNFDQRITTTQSTDFGPGVEIKSTGSNIHIPPSTHRSGNTYRWVVSPFEAKVADAPEWLVEFFVRRADARKKSLDPNMWTSAAMDSFSEELSLIRAEKYLRKLAPAVEGQGGRDATWKACIAVVRGFIISPPVALDLIMRVYNPKCVPPWPENDLRKKVESAATSSFLPLGYLYYKDPPRARGELLGAHRRKRVEKEGVMPAREGDIIDVKVSDVVAPAKVIKADERVYLHQQFEDTVDVPRDAIVPFGYVVDTSGIYAIDDKGNASRVFTMPVFISAILRDDDDVQHIRISWRQVEPSGKAEWRARIVQQETVSSKTKIERLSRYGMAVNSTNSTKLIAFLAAYMHANAHATPFASATRHLGWQKNGAFLWGNRVIEGGQVHRVDEGSVEKWTTRTCVFSEEDDSLGELRKCYRGSGALKTWRDAMGMMMKHRHARLAVLASFSTPLMEVLSKRSCFVPNFAVDFANTTSTGKTTILRLAASVWGNPLENDDNTSLIASWGATDSYIERVASIRSHLPLFLDDTKRARLGAVPRIVYMVASGQGEGRATIGGVQERRRFRTVLISTGEMRLVDFSEDGGTRGRTIQMWGPPLGTPSQETATMIGEVMAVLSTNYGVAGPAFVKWLTSLTPKALEQVREKFEGAREFYVNLAGANGAVSRQAPMFALLETTEMLLAAAEVAPWDTSTSVAREIFSTAASSAKDADRSIDAFNHLREVCASRRSQFFDIHNTGQFQPTQGWLGRWDKDDEQARVKTDIFVFRHVVLRLLEEGGFDAKSAIRKWSGDGFVKTTEKDRDTSVVRIDGSPTRALRFPFEKWRDGAAGLVSEAAQILPDPFDDLFPDSPPVSAYEEDASNVEEMPEAFEDIFGETHQ